MGTLLFLSLRHVWIFLFCFHKESEVELILDVGKRGRMEGVATCLTTSLREAGGGRRTGGGGGGGEL